MITPDEKIIIESTIKVLKKKYQKGKGTRNKELLENHTIHMQDITMKTVQHFVKNRDIAKM